MRTIASEDTLELSGSGGAVVVPGPLFKRFVAGFIDGIIIGVLCFVPLIFIVVLSLAGELNEGVINLIELIIRLPITFFYMGWFYKNRGATPGKQLMGLRVLHHQTGENLGYFQTFLREFIGKPVAMICLFIGILIMFFREDKRGWHDFIAGSEVVLLRS